MHSPVLVRYRCALALRIREYSYKILNYLNYLWQFSEQLCEGAGAPNVVKDSSTHLSTACRYPQALLPSRPRELTPNREASGTSPSATPRATRVPGDSRAAR